MHEYGYGLQRRVALYREGRYEGVMRETSGAAGGARQHTSADVAPELYDNQERSTDE